MHRAGARRVSRWEQRSSAHAARWISREFSGLLAQLGPERGPPSPVPDFEVLIVGSGYGGAVAAAELSGCNDASGKPMRVGLLERGLEFLPGAFPARMVDLPREVRGSFRGKLRGGEGLFDVRIGEDATVVVANGLGGGSLINAGVMEVPDSSVFQGARWPQALRGRTILDPYFARAQTLLGAVVAPAPRPDAPGHYDGAPLDKTQVLHRMAQAGGDTSTFRNAAITVALTNKITGGGVQLSQCKLCGDCATGCNYGAKESLDTNLLVQAHRRGAELYCGVTVLDLRRRGGLWEVRAVHTDDKLRAREGASRWISTRRLILAAGALGSSEILLRAQQATAAGTPRFSPRLGRQFSTNGDMLCFGYAHQPPANAIADEEHPPQRQIGPTITGVIESAGAGTKGDGRLTIEEMAVPGPMRRLAEELIVTADTLHSLGQTDRSTHTRDDPDPLAVNPAKMRRTSVFAVMGDDGADGALRLADQEPERVIDGAVSVVWPALRRLDLFEQQTAHVKRLFEHARLGGRLLPNPLWQLVPPDMEAFVRDQRGPLLTVHPLGGCAMGASVHTGVVNEYGAVFDAAAAATNAVHEGLYVLDGAIVPSALSTNPALTITALALRAAEHWRSAWSWNQVVPGYVVGGSIAPEERRVYANPVADAQGVVPTRAATLADVAAAIAARGRRKPTEAQFTERLSGPVHLQTPPGTQACQVELTLTYAPLPLSQLFTTNGAGRLSGATLVIPPGSRPGEVPAPCGRLRVFDVKAWRNIQAENLDFDAREARLEQAALCSLGLSGSLTVMRRAPSRGDWRILRALWAWGRNRGVRDVAQYIRAKLRGLPAVSAGQGLFALASRAGELRLFEYALKVEPLAPTDRPDSRFGIAPGQDITGQKHISYRRPGSPLRQLQELRLQKMGRHELWSVCKPKAVLSLEPRHLAAWQTTLFRFVRQSDHAMALVDALSLLAYFFRVLLSIHLWTARKPDRPRLREVQRLPGRLPKIGEPEIHWLEVDCVGAQPVRARLARYRRDPRHDSVKPPVLTIHGYSASGTTFAHPSLRPSLVQSLVDRGHEVWVLDLRSSCGLPSATHPWTFERIALADIPAAVDHVLAVTGQPQLDVVAHCMGAAMFGMAVLSADRPWSEIASTREDRRHRERFRTERRLLPQRIRRAVLSQIGPVMVLSPQNSFRAFVTSFLRDVIGPMRYRFRPEADDGLMDELLDRLLATLGYPDEELKRENTWCLLQSTEFVGSRHRMDALYGRAFKLGNLSEEVLDHIDDFFGPMNLETVEQVGHFARQLGIANHAGRNPFVSAGSLRRHWRFKTMSLHGTENELADPMTLQRMAAVLGAAGCSFKAVEMPGFGHQDCLIGRDAGVTFAHILAFLNP